MTIKTSTRVLATASVAIGISSFAAAPAAHADTERLTVAAVGAPAWAAGKAMPIDVVVSNPDVQILCDTVNVRLTWITPDGRSHGRSVAGRPLAGVWSGSISIPASSVKPGALHYQVHAAENCGMLLNTAEYVGNSPKAATHVLK